MLNRPPSWNQDADTRVLKRSQRYKFRSSSENLAESTQERRLGKTPKKRTWGWTLPLIFSTSPGYFQISEEDLKLSRESLQMVGSFETQGKSRGMNHP